MAEGPTAVIPRGSREEFRIRAAPSGGVDIRVWFKASDGTMRPGRDGVEIEGRLVERVLEAANRVRNLNALVTEPGRNLC